MPEPVTIAAFDFDHTLIRGDSMRAFLRYSVGEVEFVRKMSLLSPSILRFLLGSEDRVKVKEKVLSQFFAGKKADDLFEQGEQFARLVLPSMERSAAISRLDWHKKEGHRCFLVTASMDIWTQGWADRFGLELIATRSEVDENGILTGKIVGNNNWGPGKRKNLKEKLKNVKVGQMYAYGDSRGDKELLEMADHPYYRTFSDKLNS